MYLSIVDISVFVQLQPRNCLKHFPAQSSNENLRWKFLDAFGFSAVDTANRYGAGHSGDRILVTARDSASVQAGPGSHPARFTMGNGSRKSGRTVALTTHPHLPPTIKKVCSSTSTPTLGLHCPVKSDLYLLLGFIMNLSTTNGPSQISITEVFHFLGYYEAHVGTLLSTFRDNLSVPFANNFFKNSTINKLLVPYMQYAVLCVSKEGPDRPQGPPSPQ
jgi:hypothetical protein